MRIGLYDPYLNTLGGGEKYVLDIARSFEKHDSIDLFWDDKTIQEGIAERFGFTFTNLTFKRNIFQKGSFIEKLKTSRNYDAFFFVSDGSIPFLNAKKNFLIVQFPLPWVTLSTLDTVKMRSISAILCYSSFVKKYIDTTFKLPATVLAPAVDPIPKGKQGKENIILSVGRFTGGMNTKKQNRLIDAFIKHKDRFRGWKLVLIGGVLPQDEGLIHELEEQAKGSAIEILHNIKRERIVEYYQKAKIYWHAAGFEENLEKHPERAEHFGITTIEAMSAGVVPVVFGAGGQVEIMEGELQELTWQSMDELVEKTAIIIKESSTFSRLSELALQRSKKYSFERFSKELTGIIQ